MLAGRRPPEALRAEPTEPPELWRLWVPGWVRVGEAEGARGRRTGEWERCRAPEEGALGGRCCRSAAGAGGGGGRDMVCGGIWVRGLGFASLTANGRPCGGWGI